MTGKAKNTIYIKGARQHNLKSIDVSFPHNKFTVVTGVSGSGKSSLVFDTLYAEGQRRYVESLSSYARQFMGRIKKPDVDYITGLCPAIAIEQKVNTSNPRSTVGTSTEIYDYLKLIFSRTGKTISPVSGKEVKKHGPNDVVDYCLSLEDGQRILILSEIKEKSTALKAKLQLLLQNGFSRIYTGGETQEIEQLIADKAKIKGLSFLVIDRLVIDKNDEELLSRIADSSEVAFWEGHGDCLIHLPDSGTSESFSNRFELDGMSFEMPNTNFLSFNNPYGACKFCEGFGQVLGIDEDLVIPDKSLSLYDGCVAPWRGESMGEWKDWFSKKAVLMDFPIHRAYEDLTVSEKKLLWDGGKEIKGIREFFKYLEEKAYKIQYRVMISRYRGKTICPECLGTRLRKDASFVKLVPKDSKEPSQWLSIADILLMDVAHALDYFEKLELEEADHKIAFRIVKEIVSRLSYLKNVGLGYLGLNRLSNSLSGGESQRINLATSLGSSLTGSAYILDEPSIGLHSRDTDKLIGVLKNLQNSGNTVVVVEHDEEIMRSADHLIDIGPDAGVHGGELVFEGDFKDLHKGNSYTAQYLTGRKNIEIPSTRRSWTHSVSIKGAKENNLKNIDVKIPLEVFTVITGVSGSGKTSLVKSIIYPALSKHVGQFVSAKSGKFDKIEGDLNLVKLVEMVDQDPIGKSSRSNAVTYLKAWDSVRDLFANQQLSKMRGFKSGHFSFNVDGGRCDGCQGEGMTTVEMQFMADIKLQCESCNGKRFKDEVLEVEFNGKSVFDVLEMTVTESLEFFKEEKAIYDRLKPLDDVGLGYIKLGQSSDTLSGGEAQRVKLAFYLSKTNPNHQKHTLYIFDEPTTGLHFNDINKLMKSFNALIEKGNSVLVIEHNLDVIKCADWIIDLGPEAGIDGGHLVFEGIPEDLVKIKESYTGHYLKEKI